jgi:hypothetical protein
MEFVFYQIGYLLIISSTIFIIHASSLQWTCLQTINKLSEYDAAFSGRIDIKTNLARNSSSSVEFKKQMIQNGTHIGDYYTCGETMSWITEVFESLESQYVEYQNGKQGLKAGYKNFIGNDVIKFFEAQKTVKDRVIYHLQHVGTGDHVFTIEQVPDEKSGSMYRIYQTYNGAYSNKAWLANALTDDLYKHGDIIIPHLTYCINHSNNKSLLCMQLRSMFEGLRSALEGKDPIYDKFLEYIQTYDIQRATEMFKRSWQLYGQSRLLSTSKFFGDYLIKTKNVTEYMNVWSKTSTPFDAAVFNQWIDLYGSPPPTYFPGMPSNSLQALFAKVDYPSGYGFEIKAVYLKNNDEKINSDCSKNAAILMDSIGVKNFENSICQ